MTVEKRSPLLKAAGSNAQSINVLHHIPRAEHANILAGSSTFDATFFIQEAIDASVEATISTTDGWIEVFFPAGIYMATNLLVPPRIVMRGVHRDTCVIKQLSGASGVLLTQNADAVTAGNLGKTIFEHLNFHGNDNGNLWVVKLGDNSGPVNWGNESYIGNCTIESNAGGGGIWVRPNVSYMSNVEATGCDTNWEIAGSNLYAQNLLSNAVKLNNGTSMTISGDSHRIYGLHFEEGQVGTVTALDVTGTDNYISGVDLSVGGSTTLHCFDFTSAGLRNRITSVRYLTQASGSFGNVINDATSTKTVTSTVKVFEHNQQLDSNPIINVGDGDLSTNVYQLASNSPERHILWSGTNANVIIRVPKVANTFRPVTIMNGSAVALTIEKNSVDSGSLFYGGTTLTLEPNTSTTLINDGTNWWAEDSSQMGAAALGTVSITSAADGDILMHDGTDWVDATTLSGTYSFDNTITVTGDVAGTTIGGITQANLVDKSAVEAITGDWTFDGNHPIEGYSTGRNVFRAIRLRFQPGGTPGTNINIDENSGSTRGFNIPSITDASNLAKSASSGSFALNSGGTIVTMDITEAVVGVYGTGVTIHDVNSSSTSEMYVPDIQVSSGNLRIQVFKRGSTSLVDLTTILDAGDLFEIYANFITST